MFYNLNITNKQLNINAYRKSICSRYPTFPRRIETISKYAIKITIKTTGSSQNFDVSGFTETLCENEFEFKSSDFTRLANRF